jgi:hypothetical protein
MKLIIEVPDIDGADLLEIQTTAEGTHQGGLSGLSLSWQAPDELPESLLSWRNRRVWITDVKKPASHEPAV